MKKVASIMYVGLCLILGENLFALSVDRVSPFGNTTRQSDYDAITVTFSEQMIPLESIKDINEKYFDFNIDIDGMYRWISATTIAFYPSEQLPDSTKIVVTVKRGIKSALTGNILEKDYVWSFDTIRPVFQKSSPYNNQTDLSTKADIVLYYNMPILLRSARSKITLEENGKKINFDIRYARTNDLRSWEVGDYNLRSVLVVTPKKEFEKNTKITVNIDTNLSAIDGDLGTRNSTAITFYTHKIFEITSSDYQTVSASYSPKAPEISFSTRVNWNNLIKNMNVTPEIQMPSDEDLEDINWQSKSFSLYQLRFNPNVKYTIKISGALNDIYGQKLGKDEIITLDVNDYNPQVSIPSGMGVIESYEGIRFPIQVINPNPITVTSRYISVDNIIPYLLVNEIVYRGGDDSRVYRRYLSRHQNLKGYDETNTYIPDVVKNRYITTALYLTNYMGLKKYGFLSLMFGSEVGYNDYTYRDKAYIQVTGMGITGKFSGDSNTIFITDLKTGLPVEAATVEIRDDFNRVLETATTDKNGIVTTKGFRELNIERTSQWNPPRQWAMVTKGEDIAFINSDWGTGVSPWRMDINYDYYQKDKNYTGSMFTERGLYKPGEEVHIKGVVRENKIGNWIVANNIKNGYYTIENSRGEEIAKGEVSINDFGSYLINIVLPKDSPTGYYNIVVKFGDNTNDDDEHYDSTFSISQSFRVEEFKPLEFETRLWVEDKKYTLGESIPIKMSGWYLFGEPMISNTVTYNVSMRETSFTPPNNTGFRFTKLSWYEDEYYNDYYSTIATGSGELNEKGEYEYTPKIEASRPIHASYVNIEATVEGEDSQKVSASKNVFVNGSDYYLGIKRQGYFLDEGNPTTIQIIAVDPDGKRLDNKTVDITIVRRYWESTRKAITGGRFEWQSRQVNEAITNEIIKTKNEPVDFTFTPEKPGLYIASIRAKDDKNREVASDEYMYVIGKDYTAWAMFDDDLLELVTEKDEYKPGETASIMVKSPYKSATALVTVEREYVIDSFVTNIEGTAALIAVPIKNDYLPNIYVGVSLVKGRVEDESYTNYATDEGKPSFKIGYAALSVSPREKELNVEISKSNDEREPGEEMSVDLLVTDKDGKPFESEVMLSVVDIGVLNLIGYKTPNWFNTFYGKRPLSVASADTRLHLIGQRNYGEKGDIPGGDGELRNSIMASKELADMDVFSIRKNFLSTAFYAGRLTTDSNGKASVTFNLPDNITSFRIMASAIDKNGYFGASDDVVVVKKNLMLMPTLPEFAYVEDKFIAGTLVYNYSSEDLEVTIEAIASNVIIDNPARTVIIPKGGYSDVRFSITAEKAGEARITLLAKGGKYKDAIEKKFNINVPMITESVAIFSSISNDNTDISVHNIDINIPSTNEVYSGAGNLSVYLAPSAFSELTGGLEYLMNYPYLCFEQQLSRVYPIIVSKRLIIDMGLTYITEEALDNMVSDFLKSMPAYQSENGGFSYWPSKSWISPWLTAYATEAMLKAKREGYSVNEVSLKKALDYLYDYAKSGKSEVPSFCNDEYINLSSLAYMASILAEGGYGNDSINSLIDRLYKEVDNIPFYGQVELMRAMYYSKYDDARFSNVRQYVLNSIKEDSTTAHYEVESKYYNMYWIHSSPVRDTSVALKALIEIGYDNPINEKVIRWLTQTRKDGRYLNTQDNVAAFAAMNEYFKKYESVYPNFKAEFTMQGKTLLSETFSSRTDKSVLESFSLEEFETNSSGNMDSLDLSANIIRYGNGRLYYGVRLNYAPRKLPQNRDAGIKVERYYETKDGRKIDLSKDNFIQGEEYIVVVKVTAPFERRFAVVDSPIAAGMRILNASFATESGEIKSITGTARNGLWGTFNYTENYKDRVLLFADILDKGEHVYKYVVRATTPGEYLLPATKAEEMYNPDIFGYDGQYNVTIKAK